MDSQTQPEKTVETDDSPPRETPTSNTPDLQDDLSEQVESAQPTARVRSQPQDELLIYDRLTRESTLAQDTIGFDYVRDDGIIVDGMDHLGLVEVHPRNWLVLNDAERTAVFRAYMSFLLGLNYPIQIVALPREFDISKHTKHLQEATSKGSRSDESPILRHGRHRHITWLTNTIDQMSVKDRDFYLITRVTADHILSLDRINTPLSSIPLIGEVVTELLQLLTSIRSQYHTDSNSQVVDRCVKEVRARQNELAETLTKTGVNTRIISDRDETMDILYRQYNHVDSPFTAYNHATYTKLLGNSLNNDEDQ